MKKQKIIGSYLSVFLLLVIACLAPLTESSNVSYIKKLNDDAVATSNSGEYYAVIVACSEYKDPKNNIPKILPPISKEKLSAFYSSLLSSSNWKEENIILLLNEDATKEKIINALEETSTRVTEDDIFLFSWQGHGSEVVDDNGDEEDGTDEIICPHDIDENTYITDDELDYYFSNINSKAQILIFEACLSGGLVGADGDLDRDGRVIIVSTMEDTIGRASFLLGFPVNFGLSVAANQKYTFHARDSNEDGFISIQECFNWAKYMIFAELSMFWIGIWAYALLLAEGAGIATFSLFYELVIMEIFSYLMSGHIMLNWPHMIDNYGEELPLLKVDENKQVESIPDMPIELDDDIENIPWDTIDREYWPDLYAFAEVESKEKNKVSFKGDFFIGPPNIKFHWDFGDGTISDEQNPTHVYQEKGMYIVRLTVTDGAGRTATHQTDAVTITAKEKTTKITLHDLLQEFPLIKNLLYRLKRLDYNTFLANVK